jgi:syntaxin-binding protein 1
MCHIGSTHALTPRQFVDDLKVLDLSGTGSRAAPNGVRELQGPRPYQAFYDERYFTRDAPPPQPRPPPLGKSVSARNAPRVPPEPSLSGSTLSVNSYMSPSSNGKDKAKEKKKRFFGL